jgi:excinuclease ABC subunit C
MFKDKEGAVIYVGKAKNLKKRVSSYFQKKEHDPKTALLLSNIYSLDIVVTSNEVEALLLENNLIKKYYPKYNLDLKDSRRYGYLFFHEDKLPWIEVARTREEKGEYYGPFVSGAIRKLLMDIITRNFRILTKKPSPRMRKIVDPILYKIRVEQAKKILEGKTKELLEDLENEMKNHSLRENYEYAIILRNQINALKALNEKQLIELHRNVDANVVNYIVMDNHVYLLIFTIRKGVLEEKQAYDFQFYENFLNDFLVQYYDFAPIPQELILPSEVDLALEEYLSKKSRRKVSIMIPQKGEKMELLELVRENIDTTFFAGSDRIIALQKLLELKNIPRIIECFDISHLSGSNTVASMVNFKNGLADKSSYRKFKIYTDQNDDYLAMAQVIERRYSGSLSKSMKDPDLIVVDGGIGQLNSALDILKKIKKNIPIVSLAKRLEEIYIPNKSNPIYADRKNKGLQLLQAIRDEAHRFAINYQKLLRSKTTFNKQ